MAVAGCARQRLVYILEAVEAVGGGGVEAVGVVGTVEVVRAGGNVGVGRKIVPTGGCYFPFAGTIPDA